MVMKNTIDFIRDIFHGYLGFAFVYFCFCITTSIAFTNQSKAFGVLIASGFLGLAINVVFNFLQGLFFKIESKASEYYIAVIGGLVGGWLSLFVPNKTLSVIMVVIAFGVAIYDLIRTPKQ